MFTCSACLRRHFSSISADLSHSLASNTTLQPWVPPSWRALSLAGQRDERPRSLRRPGHNFFRGAATLRGLKKGHHIREAGRASQKGAPPLTSSKARSPSAAALRKEKDQAARDKNGRMQLTEKGQTELQKQLDKEAEYLTDPLRLAQEVQRCLRNDEFEKAHETVLASDRHGLKRGVPQGKVRNTVSWNHLIDWCMHKKSNAKALQIYQDMKKRGHVPDSHTYLLILRGLGEGIRSVGHYPRSPEATKQAQARINAMAKQAMDVYSSIFRPNSQVKLITMHSNAIINVLARAGDMSAIWAVAGQLPQKGPGSPDHWTYTTILNAMQLDLPKNIEDEESHVNEVSRAKITQVIGDARGMWIDVIKKWSDMSLVMDEKLVCAMGRLLLMSKRMPNARDVFSLVKQTMGVAIDDTVLASLNQDLDKASGANSSEMEHLARKRDAASLASSEPASAGSNDATQITSASGDAADDAVVVDESDLSQMYLQVFEPLSMDSKANSKGVHALYATPSNNTLSLLIEAAALLGRPNIGKAYWQHLTTKTNPIVPDANNVKHYLRMLRVSRASRQTLELLRQQYTGEAGVYLKSRGAFVVAMNTCLRDKWNPNVFDIATNVLDLMEQHAAAAQLARDEETNQLEIARHNLPPDTPLPMELRRPIQPLQGLAVDPKILTMYLELGLYTTKGINKKRPLQKTEAGDLDFPRDPLLNNALRALERLKPYKASVQDMLTMFIRRLEHDRSEQDLSAYKLRELRKKAAYKEITENPGDNPEELLALLNCMISAYDRVLVINFQLEEQGLGPLGEDVLRGIRLQKASTAEYVRRLTAALTGYSGTQSPGHAERIRLIYDAKQSDLEEEVEEEDHTDGTLRALQATKPVDLVAGDSYAAAQDKAAANAALAVRIRKNASYSGNFQQVAEKTREDGRPLTRRQRKYELWLENQGNMKGKTKGMLNQDARNADVHHDGPVFPEIRSRIRSRRQAHEAKMEDREHKLRLEMMRTGLSEKDVRDRRAEKRNQRRSSDLAWDGGEGSMIDWGKEDDAVGDGSAGQADKATLSWEPPSRERVENLIEQFGRDDDDRGTAHVASGGRH
ncbi:uncharacterized protein AB675_7948 [Cyphellophora attinorum]|uniref:Uncharacterized protein n=1 Tax=Cyphellophora attinorum TaxID=1664694 RepID=A0A0N1P1P1_9EURO|nr:uncharacterized protein AB675_7948 [Phialophora attinorum]KPI41073.1 hypothetical protein AB675_7948 [Phialophora attinorum]